MDGSEIQQPADLRLAEAPDAWADLRRFTSARIAIGRSGGSQRTSSLLDFRLSHARARDAVMTEFDAAELDASLKNAGMETILPAEHRQVEFQATLPIRRPQHVFHLLDFHHRTLSHRRRIPIKNPKSTIVIHQSLFKSCTMEED